ncbi:MAG: NosD domain-containing protein, partial [Chloroflexota bacterium]
NDNQLSGNTARENRQGGFIVDGSAAVRLTGNRGVANGSDGFLVTSSTGVRVEDNVAKDNAIRGFAFGNVTMSTLASNIAAGNGEGIVLAASSGNTVVSNVASGSTTSKAAGVGIWIREGSTQNVVRSNTATGNQNGGFYLDASDDNQLIANIARANQGDGFGAWASANAVFTGNSSIANTSNGFLFNSSTRLRVGANVAKGNGPDGGNAFVFLGSSDLRVEHNVAAGSPWACFGLYDGTIGVTLTGNSASGCSAGFDIGSATGNTLRDNTANANIGGNGFSLGNGAVANTLSANTANGNNNGFLLWGDASQNTLTGNIANRNTSFGFIADAAASYNTFTYDTAYGNGVLDAGQSGECVGNTWLHNHFGTMDGI